MASKGRLTYRDAVERTAQVPRPTSQTPRPQKRIVRVTHGIDGLDLWLRDLIRQGLAGLEQKPQAFWEAQAAQLVDAQAPALASRVRQLGHRVGGHPDWPARLLRELGSIAMLTRAFRRIDALPALLQSDVRQLIGWSLTQDEVLASGDSVQDTWTVVGQSASDDGRVRVQRTWLLGVHTERVALVLAFAAGDDAFSPMPTAGTAFDGELVYWPSASPQRALIRTRAHARIARPWPERLPGCDRIDAFHASFTEMLARQPWMDRTLASLRDVTPVHRDGACFVRDAHGDTLPIASAHAWPLLALSGGAPIDLGAEWDGETLTPLAATSAGEYHVLSATANGAT